MISITVSGGNGYNDWSLFYLMGISLVPARTDNYIHDKEWAKLLIHAQTSTLQPLKFGNG